MFTGLIEQVGTVNSIQVDKLRRVLRLATPGLASTVQTGDSIAVNGCCLTVSAHTTEELSFDLLGETLSRTNLATLNAGQLVNLERALSASSLIGGHFVQGHIDCTAEIISYDEINNDYRLEIALPEEGRRYVADKGSIAVDGISLTVAEAKQSSFITWIIPHTRLSTNLRNRQPGQLVNLEFDLLAKYVARMLLVPGRAGRTED